MLILHVASTVGSTECQHLRDAFRQTGCCPNSGQGGDGVHLEDVCSSAGKTTHSFKTCLHVTNTYSSTCGCDETSTASVCDEADEWEYCVVGSGPGGMGAWMALQDMGKVANTVVIERGLDASYFDSLLAESEGAADAGMGCFPNTYISASQPLAPPVADAFNVGPWTGKGDADCVVQTSGTSQEIACSNAFGGLANVNGGGWFDSVLLLVESGLGYLKESMATVSSKFGVTLAETACDNICEKIFNSTISTENVSWVKVSTTMNLTHFETTGCPKRLSFEELIKAANGNFKTGTTVDHMRPKGDRYDLLRADNTLVATCGTVILSAGAYSTPAILQRSAAKTGLPIPDGVGRGMQNHFGQYIVAACGGTDHKAPANAIPIAIDLIDGKRSQTLVYPAGPPTDDGTQIVFIIPYEGLGADRSHDVLWNSTSDKIEIRGGKFQMTKQLKDSLKRVSTATLEALQRSYDDKCYFSFHPLVPVHLFGVSPNATQDIEQVVEDFITVVSNAGTGIYHPFASNHDAVDADGKLKELDNILVADASAMLSVLMSPAAAISAKAFYTVMKSAVQTDRILRVEKFVFPNASVAAIFVDKYRTMVTGSVTTSVAATFGLPQVTWGIDKEIVVQGGTVFVAEMYASPDSYVGFFGTVLRYFPEIMASMMSGTALNQSLSNYPSGASHTSEMLKEVIENFAELITSAVTLSGGLFPTEKFVMDANVIAIGNSATRFLEESALQTGVSADLLSFKNIGVSADASLTTVLDYFTTSW